MLAWVYEAARACPQLNQVLIATDSEEVAALCRKNNWPVQLTSPDLPSGTDRVHAVSLHIPADIYVNIQGDEPLLKPEHLTALLRPFSQPSVEVTTLKVLCTPENIANPNAVKVVTAADGRALYFSRATIPCNRDPEQNPTPQYWKHIGLYAYRRAALQRFPHPSPQHPRTNRAPRAAPLPRKQHPHPRRTHRPRHHRRRHRRRPPPGRIPPTQPLARSKPESLDRTKSGHPSQPHHEGWLLLRLFRAVALVS